MAKKSVFHRAERTQAYLKCGIMGSAGTGKTRTACELAIGLHKFIVGRELPPPPVYYFDTETGFDFVGALFSEAEIDVQLSNTRAYYDLVAGMEEIAKTHGIVVIDSITHFWRELMESYMQKRRVDRLDFHDWAWLKGPMAWGKFNELFVNSPCHILMCGRLGFDYDFVEDERGRKQLEKTGVKMKAESEIGYEPSLLLQMERYQDLDSKGHVSRQWRTATVLKDRNCGEGNLDGKTFTNPTFSDFSSHIEFLNLGGAQIGLDTKRSSKAKIPEEDPKWRIEKRQKEVTLDEIKSLLIKHYPGQTKEEKQAKIALFEKYFDTTSWSKIETLKLQPLKDGYAALFRELEGADKYSEPISSDEEPTNSEPAEDDPFVQNVKSKEARVQLGIAEALAPQGTEALRIFWNGVPLKIKNELSGTAEWEAVKEKAAKADRSSQPVTAEMISSLAKERGDKCSTVHEMHKLHDELYKEFGNFDAIQAGTRERFNELYLAESPEGVNEFES